MSWCVGRLCRRWCTTDATASSTWQLVPTAERSISSSCIVELCTSEGLRRFRMHCIFQHVHTSSLVVLCMRSWCCSTDSTGKSCVVQVKALYQRHCVDADGASGSMGQGTLGSTGMSQFSIQPLSYSVTVAASAWCWLDGIFSTRLITNGAWWPKPHARSLLLLLQMERAMTWVANMQGSATTLKRR